MTSQLFFGKLMKCEASYNKLTFKASGVTLTGTFQAATGIKDTFGHAFISTQKIVLCDHV